MEERDDHDVIEADLRRDGANAWGVMVRAGVVCHWMCVVFCTRFVWAACRCTAGESAYLQWWSRFSG